MMEEMILAPVPGAAPLTAQEKAHLKRAGDSLSMAASAVRSAVAAIGAALVDGLRVAGDIATRATYGDLATGPLTLQQLQNRLAAMTERLAILELAAAFELDLARRESLLSDSIGDLFRIGSGAKAVIGQAHYWPAGLSFQEIHGRLWAMQTLLVSAQLCAPLIEAVEEREELLRQTIQAATRVAQGGPEAQGGEKVVITASLEPLAWPLARLPGTELERGGHGPEVIDADTGTTTEQRD